METILQYGIIIIRERQCMNLRFLTLVSSKHINTKIILLNHFIIAVNIECEIRPCHGKCH